MPTTPRVRGQLKLVAIGYENNPAMRIRVQQYLDALERDGFEVSEVLLSQEGRRPRVSAAYVWQQLREADVVIVQRVLLQWLNILLYAARKPVVFDLDDAVHYIRTSQLSATQNPAGVRQRGRVAYRRLVRGGAYFSSRKRLLEQMLAIARAAIFGNPLLARELAMHASCATVVVPNSVPISSAQLKAHVNRIPTTLGWIGTKDNLVHLRALEPAFRTLAARFGRRLRLHVVTSQAYRSEFIQTDFTEWSLEREGDLVRDFDIGLMPLVDDPFSRGKSSFKAILCMSYGVPVVISPVGLNAELVKDGWNGFLASTPAEWETAIARLAEDHDLRTRLGLNAFRTVEEGFSIARAYPVLKSVLERVALGERIEERLPGQLSTALR